MQIQDALVAVIALTGAAILARRLFRAMRPSSSTPACSCPSGEGACAKTAASAPTTAAHH